MPTVSIENLSPELLQMIASFLSPSDVVKLSFVTKKAAFLLPDYDQIQINNNEMIRGEYYKTTLLDIEVSAEVHHLIQERTKNASLQQFSTGCFQKKPLCDGRGNNL